MLFWARRWSRWGALVIIESDIVTHMLTGTSSLIIALIVTVLLALFVGDT